MPTTAPLLLVVLLLPTLAHATRHLNMISTSGLSDVFRPDPKYLNGLIQAGFTRAQAAKSLEVRHVPLLTHISSVRTRFSGSNRLGFGKPTQVPASNVLPARCFHRDSVP